MMTAIINYSSHTHRNMKTLISTLLTTIIVTISISNVSGFATWKQTIITNHQPTSLLANPLDDDTTSIANNPTPPQPSSRRSILQSMLTSTTAFLIPSTLSFPYSSSAIETTTASVSELSTFQDQSRHFQIDIPSTWTKKEQTLPDRRKITFFVNENANQPQQEQDLLFIAYTPIRDDFTSLASFGSVDSVGQMTILPKSTLAGQETENQLISAESRNDAYYFDYTTQSTGQPKRHFRVIFTLVQGATGGAGSVLVTLTAQTLESRYDDNMKKLFDKIIESYKKI